MPAMKITASTALFLTTIVFSDAFQSPNLVTANRRAARALSGLCSLRASDYLSSLSTMQPLPPTPVAPTPAPTVAPGAAPMNGFQQQATFSHAQLSSFSIDKLAPKGPRKGADTGNPHDAAKPLPTTVDAMKAGSWWCAAGGWPSPNERPTTEVNQLSRGVHLVPAGTHLHHTHRRSPAP